MQTETIEFTLPLEVDGNHFADIDVAIEVTVTDRGRLSTWDSPADGPEWETTGYFVDCGKWDSVTKKNRHVMVPAPADIQHRVEAYERSVQGRNVIAELLEEMIVSPVHYLTGRRM